MIITKIRIQEDHPLAATSIERPLPYLDLHLTSIAGKNGYQIKDIIGLGPPDLISVVEGFDATGIPIFGSDSVNGREIAMKIGFTPGVGQSVTRLREDIYKYISRSVKIVLMNDSLIIGQVSGYIRQVDVTHFTNTPELNLTIVSDIGYFSSVNTVIVPPASINTDAFAINYQEGSAPTGVNFSFSVNIQHNSWRVFNHARGWYSGAVVPNNDFKVSYPMVIGDVVTVNTQSNERSILLLRGGVTYDVAGYLNAGAVWPKLYSGVNGFNWDILDNAKTTLLYFKYTPRFWGV